MNSLTKNYYHYTVHMFTCKKKGKNEEKLKTNVVYREFKFDLIFSILFSLRLKFMTSSHLKKKQIKHFKLISIS